jgi:Glycosyl transferase family 2
MSIDPSRVTLAIEGWNADDLEDDDNYGESLQSLVDQSYPIQECEILVVEDGSAPSRERAVRAAFPRARILRLDPFNYYRCKNASLREARGEYLLLADSDVLYDASWMGEMLAGFRPGVELVTGRTDYARGFLWRTLTFCEAAATRQGDGFSDGFFCHNLGMARSLFERVRFADDLGASGGGAGEALRDQLRAEGIRPWFVSTARAEHPLPPFLPKRLRQGSYAIHARRRQPEIRGAALARIPLLAPFLVLGGMLVKAWGRVIRSRRELPGGALAIPPYMVSTLFARSVELAGACAYAWSPPFLRRRLPWHRLPSDTGPSDPPPPGAERAGPVPF